MNILRTGRNLLFSKVARVLVITLSQCLESHTLPVIEFKAYLWDDGNKLLFDDGSVIGV